MDEDLYLLRGLELRYFLTLRVWEAAQPQSVTDLTTRLASSGVRLAGRPSKVISDALRWEVKKGRVRRVGRGTYTPGHMPRSTMWWMQRRLDAVVAPTLAHRRAY